MSIKSFKQIRDGLIFKTISSNDNVFGVELKTVFSDISKFYKEIKTGGEGFSFSESFLKKTANDVNKINQFSTAIKNGMLEKDALKTYMADASTEAINFAQNMKMSGLSVDDFIKQTKISAVSLDAQNTSLSAVRARLDEYNSGCKNTGLSQKEFAQAVGESNKVEGNYLSSLNGGKATMRGYIAELISAKVATIGLQAATIALNMALTAAVSWLVSKFVQNVVQANERIKESAEKAISAYKEAQETLKSNKSTLDEISSSYEKLSKGVDKFGNNISLSTSEYKEYHNITNKIANMFPELVSGWDSEGNAILNVKGNVDALTEAYEKQAQAARNALLTKAGNDIFKNFANKTTDGSWTDYFGWSINASISDQIDAIETVLNGGKTSDFKALYTVLKNSGINIPITDLLRPLGIGQNEAFSKLIKENEKQVRKYLETQKTLLETETMPVKTVIDAYLEDTENKAYQGLPASTKNAVKSVVAQLDYEFYKQYKDSPTDAEAAVMEKFIKPFQTQKISNAFEYMADAQDKLNQGKMDIGGYQEQITKFLDAISGLEADQQKYIKLSLGLELDDNGNSKDIENVISQLVEAGVNEGTARGVTGKLKLPKFKEMLNNGGQFKDSIKQWLQENQGATATEFSDWLNGILSESASSISDSSSTILTAFSKASEAVTGFKAAMDDSKGTIKSGTESFEGYADAYKKATDLIDQGYDLDNGKLYAYMEFLLGKDTLEKYGYNVNKLKDKLKNLKDVFGNSDKLGNGFLPLLKDAVGEDGKLLNDAGETIAEYYKKTGEWSIDNEHFGEVADALGMTEDGLVSCIQAMSTWSNVALESLDEIKDRAKAAGAVYREQFEGKDIVNVETLRSNMQANGYTDKQTYDAIQQLKKDSNVITIDVNADSSAESIINNLSKIGLIDKDASGQSVLDLNSTVDILKETGDSVTEITDIITTLNDSGLISIKIDGNPVEDLTELRTKVEEFYNSTTSEAEKAYERLANLGLTNGYTFNFDVNADGLYDLTMNQIPNARKLLDEFRNEDGTVNLDLQGASEAETILLTLISQKQILTEPEIMKIDTSQFGESQADIKNAIDKVQEFIDLKNQLELQTEIGIDTTETQKALRSVATQIKDEVPDSVKTDLGLNTEEFDTAIATISGTKINVDTGLSISDESITSVTAAIQNIPTQNIKVGIDINEEDKVAEVKYNVDSSEVDAYKKKNDDKTATVTYHKDSTEVDRYDPKNLSRTVTYHIKTEGSVNANGTAHFGGTAKAGGDWGTAKGGTSLVGERGREIIVDIHTGRWYTVGDEGAEFANIPQGSIVFNHKQTESLLKYGHINSRGIAMAGGTAYVSGNIKNSSSPKLSSSTSKSSSSKSGTTTSKSSNKSSSKSSSKSKSKSSSKSSSKSKTSSSSDKNSTSDYTDWIEIAISRVERAIKNLGTVAKSTFQTLSTRLKASSDEIVQLNKEIDIQQKGAKRYLKQAEAVNLSSDLKKKVREGTIDITKYDEKTKNLISTYKTWYEKSLACSDAILTLKESLAQLYKDKFDDIQKDYENQLNLMEYQSKDYENRINMIEAKGYLQSAEIYKSMQSAQSQQITVMQKELVDLQKTLNQAVDSGEIAEYSEAWYSMRLQIEAVKQSISEANIKLVEYGNTMREIEWSHFDYTQDRIKQVTQESDFLIDLLNEHELYDDKGQLNNYGTAAMGLRAQNYNVYMAQSNQYAKEIKSIDKSIAEEPYNTKLIKRREELLKLQQESIKSANQEKKAIVDLVEQGIDKELDSLKKLIDEYTNELDAAKDLHDYQNKISDHTSNIASLQKQLSAYENDNSEETRAKVQKIKTELDKAQKDLKETQYDKYIADQKELLNELYNQYETALNQRLENVDQLVSDMIDNVNLNAESINSTLQEVCDDVGYTMTDNMQSIWDGSTESISSIVSLYGDNFESQLTSVNAVLNSIQSNVAALVNASNMEASVPTFNSTSSIINSDTTHDSISNSKVDNQSKTENKSKPASRSNKISVGNVINAAGARIYSSIGGKSKSQTFSNDPNYKILAIKDGWMQVRWHGLNSGVTGWIKQSDIKAYKKGGLVDYSGLAKLDGTPSKPEMVLNPQDTQNFIDFNNRLKEISKQPISYAGQEISNHEWQIDHSLIRSEIDKNLSHLPSHDTSKNISVQFGDINIDHVDDYDDFLVKLQRDTNFEKMIRAMTIDRNFGGSAMAKYKCKWK